MIRRTFRIGVWLGVLGGIAYAATKLLGRQQASTASSPSTTAPPQPWPRLDTPAPAPAAATAAEPRWADDPALVEGPADAPAPAAKAAPTAKAAPAPKPAPAPAASEPKTLAPWVDPDGDVCPTTHPVKAKLSSKIFQVKGNFAYDRTTPDRCYKDPASAESDGFRAAKR